MRQPPGQHYLDYWGFTRAPFALTPDPEMLYLSKQHREGMLRLQYAIASNKGGALLVSENPGDGKTSVLKRLQLDLINSVDDRYRVVFIDHPTLTPNQVLWEILRQMGFGEARGEKIQNLLQLRGALEEMHERGERVVFILDEGQLLADRPELLQEFRVLLNYTVGETFLLTFIFSGQAELEATMKRLPELYQRLPVRYFLHSMDPVDTGRMIDHRIKVAGYRDTELFTESAVKEIYRYSGGIPRVTCTVSDLALVVGHSRNVHRITDREVLMAIRDLDRTTTDGYHYYHFLRSAGAATPDEQLEIEKAEEALDREAAEEALHRIEAMSEPVSDTPQVEILAPEADPGVPDADLRSQEDPAGAIDRPAEIPLEPDPDRTVRETGGLEMGQQMEWESGAMAEHPDRTPLDPAGEGVDADPPEMPEDGNVDPWVDVDLYLESIDELVHCPVCGIRQSAERSTCSQCGSPLHWICPSCQYQNSAQLKRCEKCGQSLGQAVYQAEGTLREAVSSSPYGAIWGFATTPDFSLKLAEGERVLAVVKNKRAFKKGVNLRARVDAWGGSERRVDLVVTNHRLHVVSSDLQSRIPYHEIQGLRASKGKLNLFHTQGGLRMDYPQKQAAVLELVNLLIDFLEFQTSRFKV